MDAELEAPARGIEMVRHHPAEMRRHDLVAPVGEERPRLEVRLVGLLDARELRRSDACGCHVALIVALLLNMILSRKIGSRFSGSRTNRDDGSREAAARSARRAAYGRRRDPRHVGSARAWPH